MLPTKELLSNSGGYGAAILIAADSPYSPGTLIHLAHVTAYDYICLYATNTSEEDVLITLQWGDVTNAFWIGPTLLKAHEGATLLTSGFPLSGELEVRAFCSVANVVTVVGVVDRWYP